MKNTIAKFIADNFYWVFIAVLALNLFQRKHGQKAKKKRNATLYLGIGVFLLYTYAILIVQFKLSDLFLLIFAAAAAAAIYLLREKLLPFRLKCVSCSTTLSGNEIVFDDSNLCAKCKEKMEESVQPEQRSEEEEAAAGDSDSQD